MYCRQKEATFKGFFGQPSKELRTEYTLEPVDYPVDLLGIIQLVEENAIVFLLR